MLEFFHFYLKRKVKKIKGKAVANFFILCLTFSAGAFIQTLKAISSFCRMFFPETFVRYVNGRRRISSWNL